MSGRKPADAAPVIVIDLQTGMFDGVAEPPIHDAEGIVARVRAIMDWARREKRPVAFVRHDGPPDDPLAPGAPGWPVWPALGQAEDEPTFAKSVGDAFSNAALAEWIASHGADEVVLLGAQTDACIASTVTGAIKAGLEVTVVADAHSTVTWTSETVPEIIARHNAAFAAAGVNVVTTQSLIGASAASTLQG
jgi:nicotinamidase-related amidase